MSRDDIRWPDEDNDDRPEALVLAAAEALLAKIEGSAKFCIALGDTPLRNFTLTLDRIAWEHLGDASNELGQQIQQLALAETLRKIAGIRQRLNDMGVEP